MSSSTVKEQLRLACDETSSETVLRRLWETSKSIKVRRAVARNPNCSPKILHSAARLYLEDVLSNPGFPMLELFCDDPWIRKLSLAYKEPEAFIFGDSGYSSYSRKSAEIDRFGWAIMLSPNTSSAAIDKVVRLMTSGGLKRAFKNPDVKSKVSELFYKSVKTTERGWDDYSHYSVGWDYCLETIFLLYREKAISREQMFRGLSNYPLGSASAPKSLYLKYIESLHGEYQAASNFTEKDFISKLIAKTLVVSKAFSVGWMYVNYLANRESLKDWRGELYTHVLKHMMEYFGKERYNSEESLRCVGHGVVTYIKLKFVDDFEGMYSFIKSHGLDGLKFSRLGLSITGQSQLLKLYGCSMQAKKLFCFAGCLGNWTTISSGDIKYKIINEVNEYIYNTEGIKQNNLLFDECSIRKVITINEPFHVY